MKIVMPGGGGHLGRVLAPALAASGHEVVVLSRGGPGVPWDGRTLGPWASQVDGADAVINLAGRSVDCRYTASNLREMTDSRVESTRVVGAAIARAVRPPRVWLQMSTATIYAHRFDAANDEATGAIGGAEPGAPARWRPSIDIALAWERTLAEAAVPSTRRVALRTAMVMSATRGGTFAALLNLARSGLGGALAGGRQFISWIHERDFVRAIEWLLARGDIDGPVNVAAPAPLPQREFARALREACGARVGLALPAWMLEAGAFLLRTETELLLKSRRVVPARLLASGFEFEFRAWPEAARELVARHAPPARLARERGAA